MAGRFSAAAGSGVFDGDEREVDSGDVEGCGREFALLHPRSHAIIKTEEKTYFKLGFTNITLINVI
ncbi:MAG: hypothetical protein ACLQMO_12595 [Acidobacteriaceae bacterium]